MIDQLTEVLELSPKEAFVVNTDVSSGQGIHWITMKVGDHGVVYVVDSLGRKNLRPHDELMLKAFADTGLTPQWYPGVFQYEDSSLCGWFAIFCARLINKYPLDPPFKLIKDVFGYTADDGDIHQLIKSFGLERGHRLDHVLDELPETYEGSGIRGHLQGLLKALLGERDNLKPSVRKSLELDGNVPIQRIFIGREPVNSTVTSLLRVLNNISNFKGSFDQLFHLYVVLRLKNGKTYRLEKNQTIALYEYHPSEAVETQPIPLGDPYLTMNLLLANAISRKGKQAIFHYDAFSTNCQRFVLDVLSASQVPVPAHVVSFILQDVKDISPSWVKRLTGSATSLASRLNLVEEGYGVSLA
jgi:hypothetical protein